MSLYIAVDIGGTQIRAACYPPDSLTPLRVDRISTHHPEETPLVRLQRLVASIWPANEAVEAVGVAAPGPIDPYEGVILEAPNVPGWVDLPLRQLLEERFDVPVALGNDANLAALGEWRFGAGKGHHHLIYLTISTGIGSGIIINDQLLLGKRGLAAELGHITVVEAGPVCGCGHRGHLEAVASGTAIARWVQEELTQGAVSILPAGEPLSAKMIAQAASSGDPLAITALERAGEFIGKALANFVITFNPSIVVVGGGVTRSGPFLLDPMWSALRTDVFSPEYLDGLVLTTAQHGDDAGLLGALALARELYSKNY